MNIKQLDLSHHPHCLIKTINGVFSLKKGIYKAYRKDRCRDRGEKERDGARELIDRYMFYSHP